jgi:hypothetical protein
VLVNAAVLLLIGVGLWLVNRVITGWVETVKAEELAQQRLWRHDETLPASPWQSSSRSGEKCPVGTSKAWPPALSPKDTQFMTKHDDLEILGRLALAIWDQQPE